MMRGWIASFDRWEALIERTVAAGDDVVAIVSDRAYLPGSAVPIVRRFAQTFTFCGRVIVRTRLYSTPAEALEDAGVAE